MLDKVYVYLHFSSTQIIAKTQIQIPQGYKRTHANVLFVCKGLVVIFDFKRTDAEN